MYGSSPETPDALAVRSGFLARRRRLVPADTIEQIDGGTKVIGLRIDARGDPSVPLAGENRRFFAATTPPRYGRAPTG